MKFLNYIFLMMSMLFIAACSPPQNTSYHDDQGNIIHLRDKWIVINYWAPWCDSCVKEIPELNRFYEKNKDKVIVVGVSFDAMSVEDIKKFKAKLHIRYPVLIENPQNDLHLPIVEALPATFVLNPKGKITQQILGPSTEKSLQAAIKQ